MITGEPEDALEAIAFAQEALGLSPLGSGDHFGEWLLTVAVSAAAQGRELTPEEQARLREYDPDTVIAANESSRQRWFGRRLAPERMVAGSPVRKRFFQPMSQEEYDAALRETGSPRHPGRGSKS